MTRRPPALWEDDSAARQVRKMLPWSAGLHGLLALTVVIGGLFRPNRALPPPTYEVTLIAPIRKGTPGGGAPRTVVAPPTAVETAAVPVPTWKAASDELAVPDANARESALERAKREAALKRIADARAAAANAQKTPSAGGQPATQTGGGAEGAGDGGVEYGTWDGIPGSATYEQQILAIINSNWKPIGPQTDHVCIIRVKIGLDGKLKSVDLESESDSASFDANAMAAIRKSDPFPAPPYELKLYLANKGIPVRFNDRTRTAGGS